MQGQDILESGSISLSLLSGSDETKVSLKKIEAQLQSALKGFKMHIQHEESIVCENGVKQELIVVIKWDLNIDPLQKILDKVSELRKPGTWTLMLVHLKTCCPNVPVVDCEKQRSSALSKFSRHKGIAFRELMRCNQEELELAPEQLALVLSDIRSWVNIMLQKPTAKDLLTRKFLDSLTHPDQLSLRFAEHRCLKRQSETVAQVFEAFPVALTHARVSRSLYERARATTRIQNEIWMKMAFDLPFLLKETEQLAKEDEFVAEFVKIVKKKAELPKDDAPDFRFAISRNDFMVEADEKFYQVEFNLIASSLGPISQRHRAALQAIDRDFGTTDKTLTAVEEDNEKFLADSLAAAHEAYGVPEAIIVLVCGLEKNVFDQWCPSKKLGQQGIKYKRYSYTEMREFLQVDPTTRKATIWGEEVSIFYLRDGYMPHQYSPQDWEVRQRFELSRAIKCPDATLQLINMKYFQLVLNRQATWTHFGYLEEAFKECQATFCNILTVDDFGGDKQKMKDFIYKEGGVGNWVLKPQREGGANNFFDEDIITQIDTLDLQELRSFILMEKIFARKKTGVITNWKDGIKVRPLIDEIGVFQTNVFVGGKSTAVLEGGSLVRSKVAGVNEGGVGMGFAVINSIAFE